MQGREQRLTENEAIFREINERVQQQAGGHGDDGHVYTYFCECSRTECTERLQLTSADYERVRAHPKRFIVVPDHELEHIEEIVRELPGSLVVEKKGDAGQHAATLDPRTA